MSGGAVAEELPEMNEDDEKPTVSIDEMMTYVGEFKKYQCIVGTLLCVALLPVASHVLIMYFAALNPNWKCVDNSTQCLFNGTLSPSNRSRCRIPRTEWEYTEPKEYSIVTYFDIYCDDSWIIDLSTSIIFIGSLCGSIIMGWAADNYGRKKTMYISTAIIILSGTLSSFMPNVSLVIFFRFVIGFFLCGAYQSAVLLSEIVASRYRPLAGTLIWTFFTVCLCVLGLKAYFIRSWKTLFLVCSAPYVFVLAFHFVTPESPRWLRINGKMEELSKTFATIAKVNKKHVPPDLTISLPLDERQRSNPLHLFRRRELARTTIINGYAGFVYAMVYYGLSLIAGEFGGSLYRNFILFSLSEIPGDIGSIVFSTRFGRKKTTIASAFAAGVSCILLIFLHADLTTARVVVGMLGKCFITLSWNSQTIWLVELYPTTLRSQAFCFLNVFCTIGSASAPWMITGLHCLGEGGPYICMGVATLLCCVLLIFMKETKGLPTLECEADMRIENINYARFT